MAEADIVDENGDVEIIAKSLQPFVVGIIIAGEVHGQCLRLNTGMLALDFAGNSIEFRLSTGDKKDIITGIGNLQREFSADTVRSTSDEGPTAPRTKALKL